MSWIDITVWLSIFYVIGAFFHALMRADFAVKSKVNPIPNRRCFFARYWVTLSVRVFIFGYLAFYGWLNHPDWPAKAMSATQIIPDWFANWFIITPNPGSAVGFGFIVDAILDYAQSITAFFTDKYPSLKFLNKLIQGNLPTYDATVVDVAAVNQEVKP